MRIALIVLVVAVGLAQSLPNGRERSPEPIDNRKTGQAQIIGSPASLPLSFEANRGQSAAQVDFLARGSNYSLFLTPTEAVFVLGKTAPGEVGASGDTTVGGGTVLRMQLVGANGRPRAAGLAELPGKVNYFVGSDPTAWRTRVPTYARVAYHNVYPGIDLLYYGNQQQLECDFVVAPGADPSSITLRFLGVDAPHIDGRGDLVLDTSVGVIRLRKPFVYQVAGGNRQEISGRYVLQGHHLVGFEVGTYDLFRPLVIDPILVYSTYLGGKGDDDGSGIAVDSIGNVYVTGTATSADFPNATPLRPFGGSNHPRGGDAFVGKLNAAGSAFAYFTYLGGSGQDGGSGIAVDGAGNVYVTGVTGSTDFPTVNAVQPQTDGSDAFVTKLNVTGSIVYSTYLGGTGRDDGEDIAVDRAGNAYMIGTTSSANFPTAKPLQPTYGGGRESGFVGGDVFVVKLNAAGSALIYSTYLGGRDNETGYGIAVDTAGNTYLTGLTESANFPTRRPLQRTKGGGLWDAFVAKLNAAGSALVYATYLGGSEGDIGVDIAVDAAGSAYVTGVTESIDFPTKRPLQRRHAGGEEDAFVAKLNPAGSGLVFSTYWGRSAGDVGSGIAVDAGGNVYVTGWTTSTSFEDAFVLKMQATGSALIYVASLGGSGEDRGYAIALDRAGNVYVTGETGSANFPIARALQPTFGGFGGRQMVDVGGGDAFVAKLNADR